MERAFFFIAAYTRRTRESGERAGDRPPDAARGRWVVMLTIFEVRALLGDLIGQSVTVDHPSYPTLVRLVEHHPRAGEKLGGGVDGFVIRWSRWNRAALELLVVRPGGALVDVSWRKCVSGKPSTTKSDLRRAMRYAILPQIQHAYDAWGSEPCGICGLPIEESHRAHVDHVVPFEQLAVRFLAANKTSQPDSFDEHPVGHAAVFAERDRAFDDEWQRFHEKYAVLCVVHARCNLTRSDVDMGRA
jgi:hypothetical protein